VIGVSASQVRHVGGNFAKMEKKDAGRASADPRRDRRWSSMAFRVPWLRDAEWDQRTGARTSSGEGCEAAARRLKKGVKIQ